jgi:2-amino-4-hydroxy-6-hydroxymethyldihydropteridine diphosphokinase
LVEACIALGSNVGEREENLRKAIEILKGKMTVVKTSSFYETKPMYVEDQGWFLNCTAKVDTDLKPRELLEFLKKTEKELGRKVVKKNGPRIIDLDILFYGNQIINDNDLQIPHPKIAERLFVLAPLAEIEPNLSHPVYNKTISELLFLLNCDKSEIRRVI